MNATIWHSDRCQVCNWSVSARSGEALQAAVAEHVAYVNATKDKDTDPHFEEARLTRLVNN